MTTLNKKGTEKLNVGETMDRGPVCKGESLWKVITKALYSPSMETIREKCKPCQFSIGTKGGGSQLVMAITLLLEANAGWVVIALDIVNAFKEIERKSVLEVIWDNKEIRRLWYYNMRCKTVVGFVGLGYRPGMVKTPFCCKEGEKQGDMELMPNFCLGIDKVNNMTLSSLKDKGGWLVSRADDTYFLGPPSVAFAEVKEHEERLRSIGLALHYRKMKCYIANLHRDAEYKFLRNAFEIEVVTLTHDNTIRYDIKAYGIPIADLGFINRWLNLKSMKIGENLNEIGELLDLTAISPQEVPSRQCLWLLTLICSPITTFCPHMSLFTSIYTTKREMGRSPHLNGRLASTWKLFSFPPLPKILTLN